MPTDSVTKGLNRGAAANNMLACRANSLFASTTNNLKIIPKRENDGKLAVG
jgi:hypothetical protein